MFSQRNNPYCDLLENLCCKITKKISIGKFFVQYSVFLTIRGILSI